MAVPDTSDFELRFRFGPLSHSADQQSQSTQLTPAEYTRAKEIFDAILGALEESSSFDKGAYLHRKVRSPDQDRYRPLELIRHTLDHVHMSSQGSFLELFFASISLYFKRDDSDISECIGYLEDFRESETKFDKLKTAIPKFAHSLVENFFIPLMASGGKTRQPTPADEPLHADSEEAARVTAARLSSLRRDCLKRDGYRCVITGTIDDDHVKSFTGEHGESVFKDPYGNPVSLEENRASEVLEVAHIIPHSLLAGRLVDGDTVLVKPKRMAYQILRMFDPDVVGSINGVGIDRPFNAMTLTHRCHTLFGKFKIVFDEMGGQEYKIHTANKKNDKMEPVVRTLVARDGVEPVARGLLAIHRAIATILHLSAAGEYIEKLIRDNEDMEGGGVLSPNGSTSIGDYIYWKLCGSQGGIIEMSHVS
ncbi:hypothetical protein BJX61DRAFT_519996 [Aspergillus egyptiacus]|nr:hypothetical protein BJX61DRAFT_519996 [Aspergillus egyptiacus]